MICVTRYELNSVEVQNIVYKFLSEKGLQVVEVRAQPCDAYIEAVKIDLEEWK